MNASTSNLNIESTGEAFLLDDSDSKFPGASLMQTVLVRQIACTDLGSNQVGCNIIYKIICCVSLFKKTTSIFWAH